MRCCFCDDDSDGSDGDDGDDEEEEKEEEEEEEEDTDAEARPEDGADDSAGVLVETLVEAGVALAAGVEGVAA